MKQSKKKQVSKKKKPAVNNNKPKSKKSDAKVSINRKNVVITPVKEN